MGQHLTYKTAHHPAHIHQSFISREMKFVKVFILFSFYVILTAADGSQEDPPAAEPHGGDHESQENSPPPPPPTFAPRPPSDPSIGTFDPDSCEVHPPPTNEELDEYFSWMDDHNKTWLNARERKCKLIRVIYNMRDIRAHNQRFKEGKETFERSLWGGSEFTFDEKVSHYVGEMPKDFSWRQAAKVLPKLPAAVDAVNYIHKGFVSPSTPQGMCGSCYAWAAVTPLEAQVRKCGISNETLSVQSMVDCCTQGCWGCSSGWPQ
jgi:hypothetical protein